MWDRQGRRVRCISPYSHDCRSWEASILAPQSSPFIAFNKRGEASNPLNDSSRRNGPEAQLSRLVKGREAAARARVRCVCVRVHAAARWCVVQTGGSPPHSCIRIHRRGAGALGRGRGSAGVRTGTCGGRHLAVGSRLGGCGCERGCECVGGRGRVVWVVCVGGTQPGGRSLVAWAWWPEPWWPEPWRPEPWWPGPAGWWLGAQNR